MSEKEEQKRVCEYLKMIGLFFFAIPAVCFNKRQGGYPIGYKKGMPDLHIPELDLYIEMKACKDRHIEHVETQTKVHEELKRAGKKVHICIGSDEAIKVIDEYYRRNDG